jgi:hypothetical protein
MTVRHLQQQRFYCPSCARWFYVVWDVETCLECDLKCPACSRDLQDHDDV